MKILDAFKLAAHLHSGQQDLAGRPYIEHLSRVFLRVLHAGGDRYQQIAALLHDAIEDGKATADDLIKAGVPLEAVEIIVILTRKPGQAYIDYVAATKASPRAAPVKMSDLEDNMDPERLAKLDPKDAARLAQRYKRAHELLLSEAS